MAPQTPITSGVATSPLNAAAMIERACRPISRKTALSSRNWMLRQLSRSAMRDCAVCRIGALWPSSRPATTTATTPDGRAMWSPPSGMCTASAATYAANGVMKLNALSISGSVMCLRAKPTTKKKARPIDHAAEGGHDEVPGDAEVPDDRRAASAVLSATRAVASLNSDSPSRIVTIRRGSPIRRPIDVAATASGGATTAPMAQRRRPAESRAASVHERADTERREHDQADRAAAGSAVGWR